MRLAQSLLQSYVKGYLGPSNLAEISGVSDPLLFSDTFTDTNGTLLTAHTPDVDVVGGGWLFPLNSFDIQSNAATSSVGAACIAAVETSEADVIVGVTILPTEAQIGALVRLSDNSNYWMSQVSDGKLYETVAGAFTERADVGAPSALPNTMSMECSGSSITLSMETGLSATYASATFNQTETKHGFRAANIGRICDDFSVNTL